MLCCDAYFTLDDNMQAIHKTVEAIRGIDRWKVADMLNRTFTGFKALPETTGTENGIWQTLGLSAKPASLNIVHSAYKTLAKKYHPDKLGGSAEAFQELQEALKFFNWLLTQKPGLSLHTSMAVYFYKRENGVV